MPMEKEIENVVGKLSIEKAPRDGFRVKLFQSVGNVVKDNVRAWCGQ